jgi:hypothetical protein
MSGDAGTGLLGISARPRASAVNIDARLEVPITKGRDRFGLFWRNSRDAAVSSTRLRRSTDEAFRFQERTPGRTAAAMTMVTIRSPRSPPARPERAGPAGVRHNRSGNDGRGGVNCSFAASPRPTWFSQVQTRRIVSMFRKARRYPPIFSGHAPRPDDNRSLAADVGRLLH